MTVTKLPTQEELCDPDYQIAEAMRDVSKIKDDYARCLMRLNILRFSMANYYGVGISVILPDTLEPEEETDD